MITSLSKSNLLHFLYILKIKRRKEKKKSEKKNSPIKWAFKKARKVITNGQK